MSSAQPSSSVARQFSDMIKQAQDLKSLASSHADIGRKMNLVVIFIILAIIFFVAKKINGYERKHLI